MLAEERRGAGPAGQLRYGRVRTTRGLVVAGGRPTYSSTLQAWTWTLRLLSALRDYLAWLHHGPIWGRRSPQAIPVPVQIAEAGGAAKYDDGVPMSSPRESAKPPRKRQARVTFLGAIAIVVILGIGWASARYMEYRHESALRSGIGDLKEGKYSEALAKITPYAREGNRFAQATMSFIHAHGLGVPVDPIRARIWLRRVECRCDTPGKVELDTAHSFLVGAPPPKDAERALYWYEQAAEAGNKQAQRLLAEPEQVSKQGLIVPSRLTDYWREFLKRPE